MEAAGSGITASRRADEHHGFATPARSTTTSTGRERPRTVIDLQRGSEGRCRNLFRCAARIGLSPVSEARIWSSVGPCSATTSMYDDSVCFAPDQIG